MKKKYIAAAAVSMMVMGAFAGCGNAVNSGAGSGAGNSGGADVGRDAALEAALNDAGVNEEDTTRLKVSEERDDGRQIYEIRFDVAEKEYDYEVLASDGTIISSDVEINEGYRASDSSTQNQGQNEGSAQSGGEQNNTSENQNSSGGADVAVSRDEAMQIALERVPGAAEQDVRIELDRDDGRFKYEGDIIFEQREYDFEIDANSGEILEWSEERA